MRGAGTIVPSWTASVAVPGWTAVRGGRARAAACWRRRRTTSTGSARKAARMSRPTVSSMIFSHCGMPAAAGAFCVTGTGWCREPADGDGGGAGRWYRRWARPGVGGAGAGGCGNVSTVPAWMMSGSEPMARRLAAYRAGQPPRTANRAAITDSVSPLRTTYFMVWLVAVTGDAATLTVLVRMTSVVLPAV